MSTPIIRYASSLALLTIGCQPTPTAQPPHKAPVTMVSLRDWCYTVECTSENNVSLRLDNVTSTPTTDPPIELDISNSEKPEREHVELKGQVLSDTPTSLVIPLVQDCHRRQYVIELTAHANGRVLTAEITNECAGLSTRIPGND